MVRSFRRVGASLIVAALILPHIAFAAWTTPASSAGCMTDGGLCSGGWDANLLDGNVETGFEFTSALTEVTFLLDSTYSVNGLKVDHVGVDANKYCDEMEFYTGPNLGSMAKQSSVIVPGAGPKMMSSTFTAVPGTNYVRFKCLSVNSGSNYYPGEFAFGFAAASVPEMGVWALLIILPIMGYVVYQSTPAIRPTAV